MKPIFEGTLVRPTEPVHYWVQGFLVGAVLVGLLAWAYIWVVNL